MDIGWADSKIRGVIIEQGQGRWFCCCSFFEQHQNIIMRKLRKLDTSSKLANTRKNPKEQILESLMGLIGRLKRQQGRYLKNRKKAE